MSDWAVGPVAPAGTASQIDSVERFRYRVSGSSFEVRVHVDFAVSGGGGAGWVLGGLAVTWDDPNPPATAAIPIHTKVFGACGDATNMCWDNGATTYCTWAAAVAACGLPYPFCTTVGPLGAGTHTCRLWGIGIDGAGKGGSLAVSIVDSTDSVGNVLTNEALSKGFAGEPGGGMWYERLRELARRPARLPRYVAAVADRPDDCGCGGARVVGRAAARRDPRRVAVPAARPRSRIWTPG